MRLTAVLLKGRQLRKLEDQRTNNANGIKAENLLQKRVLSQTRS